MATIERNRGRTFSPAERWYEGSPEDQQAFAEEKLLEVASLLADEAMRVSDEARRWRIWPTRRMRIRRTQQRVYDLIDAQTTIKDALRSIRRSLEELIVTCRVCRGSGKAWGANPNKPCEGCGGAGKVRVRNA